MNRCYAGESGRNLVPNSSIKEVGHFGKQKGPKYLLDGHDWLPGARGDFLDRVEDDAIRVDWNTARLLHRRKRNEREEYSL